MIDCIYPIFATPLTTGDIISSRRCELLMGFISLATGCCFPICELSCLPSSINLHNLNATRNTHQYTWYVLVPLSAIIKVNVKGYYVFKTWIYHFSLILVIVSIISAWFILFRCSAICVFVQVYAKHIQQLVHGNCYSPNNPELIVLVYFVWSWIWFYLF